LDGLADDGIEGVDDVGLGLLELDADGLAQDGGQGLGHLVLGGVDPAGRRLGQHRLHGFRQVRLIFPQQDVPQFLQVPARIWCAVMRRARLIA